LQCLETEFVVEPSRQSITDAWYGREHTRRIVLAPQSLERGRVSMADEIANRASEARSDMRKRSRPATPWVATICETGSVN
jgi:hypothetical protein